MTSKRPTVGNLVVPYMVDADRHPIDFKAVDAGHVRRCSKDRLCGICGRKIQGSPIAFVGPDDGRRCFADPWMHLRCARQAMEQCPFLAGRRDWRDDDAREDPLLQRYSAGMSLMVAPDGRSHRDELGGWHFESLGILTKVHL